jgi:hypothetical protein
MALHPMCSHSSSTHNDCDGLRLAENEDPSRPSTGDGGSVQADWAVPVVSSLAGLGEYDDSDDSPRSVRLDGGRCTEGDAGRPAAHGLGGGEG